MEINVRAKPIAEPVPMLSGPASSARILLVEDDVSLLNALGFALEADGYRVMPFTTAADAMALTGQVDCLVVDRKLPDMDGLALIASLRRRGVLAPAILITSNPDDACRRAAAHAGVLIVEKPLVDGELRQRIEAAVRGSG
jgi:DNA-binding response OmpR family regulator